ncbi:MAG: AraC family transcriptional regulator, partial [Paenibacillaceae bacterium]|nr:AraC family transcriptional regulator [Paenibacillaceae bacterium]
MRAREEGIAVREKHKLSGSVRRVGVRWILREAMRLEWLQRMKNALDLIEGNMEEQLDITEIARAACSSTFHFQRMFNILTGMTVAEYVR